MTSSAPSRGRLVAGAITSLLLVGLPLPVRCAEPPRVLVLQVACDGVPQDDLHTQVVERLLRMHVQVLSVSTLPPEQLRCREPACMSELASAQRADLVLAGGVQLPSKAERRRGARPEGTVEVRVLQIATAALHRDTARCDPRDVEECLRDLTGRLIEPLLPVEPLPAPPPVLPAVSTQPAPPLITPRPPDRRSRLTRLGLTIGLGTLAVASLGTAIGLSALNGTRDEMAMCRDAEGVTQTGCRYSLTAALVPGYVAAGLLGGAAALPFFLPSSSEVRR